MGIPMPDPPEGCYPLSALLSTPNGEGCPIAQWLEHLPRKQETLVFDVPQPK